MFTAINKIVGVRPILEDYSIQAVTEGEDALGEVRVKIRSGSEIYKGRGASTDILESSALAYLNAVNQMILDADKDESSEEIDDQL
jgi:2-isopropylmalate synthase